jgi:hypothetical protein
MQRTFLFRLAAWEILAAEKAAMQQGVYYPPTRCALWQVLYGLYGDGLLSNDFGPGARREVFRVGFERHNPSRAMRTLVERGFVHRLPGCYNGALALTRAGFAEAVRLGANSDIVDLDTLQERWADFA